jgi:hypothetical protein
MKNIKDKTYEILKEELFSDDDGVFYIHEDIMDEIYSDDKDYPVIKEKILKVVEKMNSMSEEDLDKFIHADFQEDLFDTI